MIGLLPDEESRFSGESLDRILIWAASNGASDITFETDREVYVEVHGVLSRASRHRLSDSEIHALIVRAYGQTGASRLAEGQDFDVAYEVVIDRRNRLRFRVNATAVLSDGSTGAQLTFRSLPTIIPDRHQVRLEPEILPHLGLRQGLILITGGTGEGKSTTMAAAVRYMAEEAPDFTGKILSYEAPVEFLLSNLSNDRVLISQSQIGTSAHLPSFERAAENALRRHPRAAIVGESRDRETISACAALASTGHLVLSTVHTNGVAETIRRMAGAFDGADLRDKAVTLADSLRLVVSQRLVRKADGTGRLPMREFLAFDDVVRAELLRSPTTDWPQITRRFLYERGRPMEVPVKAALRAGEITAHEAASLGVAA